MTTDDLASVLAVGHAQLRAAQDVPTPSSVGPVRGTDRDGLVEVVIDGHGILTDIVFADDVGRLTPAELEAAVLEATQDAYRATGRPRVRSLPDIGDSEVAAGVRRVLAGEGS